MTAHIPEGITPEYMEQLINNPGVTISNGNDDYEVRTPSTHVDIANRSDKGVRPQIGGHINGKDRISTPSHRLAERLSQGFNQQQSDLAEETKRQEEAKAMTAESLNSRIAYLERTLKKVQSQVRKLEKQTDEI